MVSDYLQKTSGTCRYSYNKLKDVLYLVSQEHVKNVYIDDGEAYISGLTELPLRINGFNIQFNEESSLDERYKFQKTLTLSMHGYVNYNIFGGRYYAIIESEDGTFFMVNVDFPSRITHTFNLSQNTNQTDFTFASLSNFPTLKLNAEFEAVSPVCMGLNVYGIDKLQLLEKEKAKLDVENKTVISTEAFKTIEFLGNSCSFQEVYDGFKVTDTITFNISLDAYKPSWQYNLLEFIDNRYAAIITPKGNDNRYYAGFNFGLQPNYTIQTASQDGQSDIITVTLVEMSSNGSTADRDWGEDQSTETRWRWVKRVGEIICYECIGLGLARYLVKQEVDYFGNPTGNYQVMEGYESQYPVFHIVGTFTEQEIFETSECSDSDVCNITTTIPISINFNAITCNTYTLQTSCDWHFDNIPSNIAVTPLSGLANSSYTVSICNTVTPTSAALENSMSLKCCNSSRIINIVTQSTQSCIKPQTQYINCLSQNVIFSYDGNCQLQITSIDPKLTYTIANNSITISVPRNESTTSSITWTITAINCNCSSGSSTFTIIQDKTYERWVVEDGYMCESGNSYQIERKYTGTTSENINVRTDVTRKGDLITSGDTRCATIQTKWEWDNESYTCENGNKFKVLFEYISYDGGSTWTKTGKSRLGDMVESASTYCQSGTTAYSWVLTTQWTCEPTPSPTPPSPTPKKLIANYSDETTYSIDCDSATTLTTGDTKPSGYEYSAMTDAQIGDCITAIGDDVFYSCSSLSSITIPDSVTNIGSYAFYKCSGLTSITIPSGVTSISSSTFYSCSSLSSITIPDSVTTIGNSAFRYCSGLTSIDIPDSVTSISSSVFANCSGLTSVNIPSGITSIGINAFYRCSSLSSVTIPDSVTTIGNSAFRYCNGLTSIDIPDSVTSIGNNAFANCSGLTSITIESITPPTLGIYAFNGSTCSIYVPASSVDTYKETSGWSDYSSRITAIPNS